MALWLSSGLLAFIFARIVPKARDRRWTGELIASLLTALAGGVIATALDFGGWREPDWRAGVFAFLLAFGAAGIVRTLRLKREN